MYFENWVTMESGLVTLELGFQWIKLRQVN